MEKMFRPIIEENVGMYFVVLVILKQNISCFLFQTVVSH